MNTHRKYRGKGIGRGLRWGFALAAAFWLAAGLLWWAFS